MRLRKALFASVLALLPTMAEATAPLGMLDRAMAQGNVGRVIKTFPGPGGLTGVVIDRDGDKAIIYLTPDGRYMISGIVADLSNGKNITSIDGEKYVGNLGIVHGARAAQIAFQCANLSGVTVGPKGANNEIIGVFDPTTPQGKKIMAAMMGETGNLAHQGKLNILDIKMVVLGTNAPGFLSVPNQDRARLMPALLKGSPMPAPSPIGQGLANRNETVLKGIPLKPPFLVLYLPQAHVEAAMSTDNLLQVQSMFGAASMMAPNIPGGQP